MYFNNISIQNDLHFWSTLHITCIDYTTAFFLINKCILMKQRQWTTYGNIDQNQVVKEDLWNMTAAWGFVTHIRQELKWYSKKNGHVRSKFSNPVYSWTNSVIFIFQSSFMTECVTETNTDITSLFGKILFISKYGKTYFQISGLSSGLPTKYNNKLRNQQMQH